MDPSVKQRVYILDACRGLAVVGMIIHHSYVLLNFTHGVTFSFFSSSLFYVLQAVFVGIFLLVSGICTNYSRNIAKRGGIVFAAAVIVTVVTALLLPLVGIKGLEIYFGILHMFGLSMLLYALIKPFLDRCHSLPIILICAFLYIAQSVLMYFIPYAERCGELFMIFGFPSRTFYSADYYPLLPYFFVFVIGAMIGRWVKEGKFPKWFYEFRVRPLEFVGRHSLIVYLVHQPIVFVLITAFYGILQLFS